MLQLHLHLVLPNQLGFPLWCMAEGPTFHIRPVLSWLFSLHLKIWSQWLLKPFVVHTIRAGRPRRRRGMVSRPLSNGPGRLLSALPKTKLRPIGASSPSLSSTKIPHNVLLPQNKNHATKFCTLSIHAADKSDKLLRAIFAKMGNGELSLRPSGRRMGPD